MLHDATFQSNLIFNHQGHLNNPKHTQIRGPLLFLAGVRISTQNECMFVCEEGVDQKELGRPFRAIKPMRPKRISFDIFFFNALPVNKVIVASGNPKDALGNSNNSASFTVK